MGFSIESRPLGEIVVLATDVFEDERGFFLEAFRADRFRALGLPHEFLQDNHSRSRRGVLRGLHYQWDPPMSKLMRVTAGRVFLVAVDIRNGSPTLGRWFGLEVSAENKKQVWAPPGFARGFLVLSEWAELQYKCTALYNPQGEGSIRWNDPAIGVRWPELDTGYLLSDKDRTAQSLEQWLASPQADALNYRVPSTEH